MRRARRFAARTVSVLLAMTIWAYRNRRTLDRKHRAWLYFGPFMCVLAVLFINAQAQGLAEYAETCTELLRGT
jgi:hypothetical protein